MKNFSYYLFLVAFYINNTQANSLNINNLTSGQISITLQTSSQTVSQTLPANLNPILNDVNEPNPNPTVMNFDNNPIEKITINRFNPNTPQIIYYDGQNTADSDQKPGGIKNLNLRTGGSNMLVWNDYVEINNVAYSLNNLESYIFKANKLKSSLSSTNIDATLKEVNDLSSSIDLVRNSDLGSQLSMQIISIQAIIDEIENNIKIMKSLNDNLEEIKNLENNLAVGNNNMTGTNLPYTPADDSMDRAQKKLASLQDALKTIAQSHATKAVEDQILVVKKAMSSLQDSINRLKVPQKATNYEMLVPVSTNLQTFQNT